MRDLVGHDEPMLFTEKLNLKRAGHGGANPLHQDYPYWKPDTPRAAEIATAVLFLDDATIENGCLHDEPGSHRDGVRAGRTDGDAFLANEIDSTALGDVHLEALEVEAGTIVFFGAFLVHCSAPNTSGTDRRALLFSYQPPTEPCPTQLDLMRRLAEAFAP
jgi:phytanoyl-CoA hydroxylase